MSAANNFPANVSIPANTSNGRALECLLRILAEGPLLQGHARERARAHRSRRRRTRGLQNNHHSVQGRQRPLHPLPGELSPVFKSHLKASRRNRYLFETRRFGRVHHAPHPAERAELPREGRPIATDPPTSVPPSDADPSDAQGSHRRPDPVDIGTRKQEETGGVPAFVAGIGRQGQPRCHSDGRKLMTDAQPIQFARMSPAGKRCTCELCTNKQCFIGTDSRTSQSDRSTIHRSRE